MTTSMHTGTCTCPRCRAAWARPGPGAAATQALEVCVAEAVLEYDATEEADTGALSHALGQVWRDLPPELKAYLRSEAWRLLQQLRRDPRGLLWQVLGLSALLIRRHGLPPAAAVRRAVHRTTQRVAAGTGSKGKLDPVSVKARRLRSLRRGGTRKRGSGRGTGGRRFEAWAEEPAFFLT